LPNPPLWQTELVPASYNGAPFYVEVQTCAGGFRLAPHEFPKKNIPWVENMGRRVRHWSINGYLIYSPIRMPDVLGARDNLIAALETPGQGLLILPTGLEEMYDEPPGAVMVDTYSVIEHRERGGWCEFEMVFIEAGQTVSSQPVADTAANVLAQAQGLNSTAASSTDITSPAVGSVALGAQNLPNFPGQP
jgi:prophage DNA circulation protein